MSQDEPEVIVPLTAALARVAAIDDAMSRALKIMCGGPTHVLCGQRGSGLHFDPCRCEPHVTLSRPVALLLADLLDRASDAFSVRSCNDYTFPAEAEPAREAILRAYAAWNGSPDVPAHPGDWTLMAVGAAVLRNPGLLGRSA